MVVVEGTDSDDLKRGPGRDARTYMPGEGKLVYIAGHRTTYSAPFADIDALRTGDRISIEMPYGTFVYAVTRHRIVDDEDLSVLRSGRREELALQACHPRFFATQRYIVWARPVHALGSGGRLFALPQTTRS
jgi:sortase A